MYQSYIVDACLLSLLRSIGFIQKIAPDFDLQVRFKLRPMKGLKTCDCGGRLL